MNYLKSKLFGTSTDNQEHVYDPVARYIPSDMIEEIKACTLSGFSLFKLEPSKKFANKQEMECQFMNASLFTTFKVIKQHEENYNLPLLVIENDDYDEEQEQSK